jgi:hypothetical protein
MMYLNDIQKSQFDYIYNGQQMISNDFFAKERNTKMYDIDLEEKNEKICDFLEDVFGIVDSKNLKQFFEECKFMFYLDCEMQMGLSENDYEKMIQIYFNKREIDLSDVNDRRAFKNFCNKIFVEEKDEFELPNAGDKNVEYIKEKGRVFII